MLYFYIAIFMAIIKKIIGCSYSHILKSDRNIRQDYRIDLIMKKRIKVNPGDHKCVSRRWLFISNSFQMVL